MTLGTEAGAEVRRRPVRDIVPAAFASDSLEPSRVQNPMKLLVLGSGIDKSLNLNVFFNPLVDASNHYKGLKKLPKRFAGEM